MYNIIMDFEKVECVDNLEMSYISNLSGGYISRNTHVFNRIELNELNKFILEKSVFGTPIFKLGHGENKLLILSGIHGNELPSQIANIRLLNELVDKKINGTVFFIPFAAPKATMENKRLFNTLDLNRAAHVKNSLSNLIIQKIEELGISFVGDFHSTAFNSNPGFESIFSTKSPTAESFLIANYIARDIDSRIIALDCAGESYMGAVEDVCNVRGIPAITGEVLSPFASVGEGSVERSYLQMKSFLSYFGIWSWVFLKKGWFNSLEMGVQIKGIYFSTDSISAWLGALISINFPSFMNPNNVPSSSFFKYPECPETVAFSEPSGPVALSIPPSA